MSHPILYRAALARVLSQEERRLVESCLARSEQVDALARTLPDMILENRRRREGPQVTFTKSQLRTIRSFERDSRKAAAELPQILAAIPSVHLLLVTAIEGERTALRMDMAVHAGGHPEDEALARPLLELRAANIADLEAFGSGRAQQEVTPGGDP